MGLVMRLLLDTVALIWLASEPRRLSASAKAALEDADNDLFLSHASAWEICLKHRSGKLRLPEPPRSWIPGQLAAWQIESWPLDLETFYRAADLPLHHKDPFDRAILAHALIYRATILSPDPAFAAYKVNALW